MGKLNAIIVAAVGLFTTALFSATPAAAQTMKQQSCTAATTQLVTQVSVTKQSLVAPTDGYVTNYYTGWNGNCWSPEQDAFVMSPLGNGPFQFVVTIFDPQNLGFKFTDAGGTGCISPGSLPAATDAVVFGKIDNKGRVGPLSTWPIPGLSPNEQGEYSNFAISADAKSLYFSDRDNSGPDYHFGVWICDPQANTGDGVWVFLSDPGQQPKGKVTPDEFEQ